MDLPDFLFFPFAHAEINLQVRVADKYYAHSSREHASYVDGQNILVVDVGDFHYAWWNGYQRGKQPRIPCKLLNTALGNDNVVISPLSYRHVPLPCNYSEMIYRRATTDIQQHVVHESYSTKNTRIQNFDKNEHIWNDG